MYDVKIIPKAKKDLDLLQNKIFSKIEEAIISLKENSRPPGCKKLYGDEGYRVKIGNYRILYRVDGKNKTIFIYRIKHRKEVYR